MDFLEPADEFLEVLKALRDALKVSEKNRISINTDVNHLSSMLTKFIDKHEHLDNKASLYNDDSLLLKLKAKDSVFTHMFGMKSYVYRLYKDLYSDDMDTTEDDIIITTLDNTLVDTIYNDLSFIVKGKDRDRYIIFVEAQSSWNYNMTLRLGMYYFEVLKRYFASKKIASSDNSKIVLPMPEFYVVYTGDRKMVPDMESFNDVYFNGKAPIDIKIKIISKIDDSICGQYIGFCKILNEQTKIYKGTDDSKKCITEIIRICREKGYLVDYLNAHESEVVTVMDDILSSSYLFRMHEEELIAKGKAEGKKAGVIEGITKVALNLIKTGNMTLSSIAEVTDLSLAEVEAIAKENGLIV